MNTLTYDSPVVGKKSANWRSQMLAALIRFAHAYKATNARFSFSHEENFYITLDFSGSPVQALNEGQRDALESRVRDLVEHTIGYSQGPVTIASGINFLTCTSIGIATKSMPADANQTSTVVAFGFALASTNVIDTEAHWNQLLHRIASSLDLPGLKIAGHEQEEPLPTRSLKTFCGTLHMQKTAFAARKVQPVFRCNGVPVLTHQQELAKVFKPLAILDLSEKLGYDLPGLEAALLNDPAQFAAVGPNRVWILNNRQYTTWLEHADRLITTDFKKNSHLLPYGIDKLDASTPENKAIKADSYPKNFLINIYEDSEDKFLIKRLMTGHNAARAHLWVEVCTQMLRWAIARDLIPALTEDNKLKLPMRYNRAPIFFGFNVSHNSCAFRVDRSQGRILFMANPRVWAVEKTQMPTLFMMAASLVASLPDMASHARQRLQMELVNLFLEEA